MSDVSPLAQCTILVTRPALEGILATDRENDFLAEGLRRRGANVVVQPAIRLFPPSDWTRIDGALAKLSTYDWLVFSSANGVRALLERRRGSAWRHSLMPRIAAMGPGTAEELARFGFRAELVPREFRAEALADVLARDAVGKRFLLARASRGREVLAERLCAAGAAAVEQIVVYESADVERPAPEIAALLREGKIDWITVTSSAIARSLARMFGEQLRRVKLASISPVTSQTLRELGYQPAAEAKEYTLAGLIASLVEGRM